MEGREGRGVRLVVFFVSGLLIGSTGCKELSDFGTGPDEQYVGRILGVDESLGCGGDIPCSFIRRGFSQGTEVILTFDPEKAQYDPGRPADFPGTVTSKGEPCGATFVNEPLLPIPPLDHDALGLYELPGGGRVRNYIFAIKPAVGPLAGRDVMAFVSLMREGKAELRIVAGAGQSDCSTDECSSILAGGCDFFGVFPLERVSTDP
jgi:hypothetical protein